MQALIEKYQPRKFDPEESAALMQSAGFTLNQDGFWQRDNATLECTLIGFQDIHSDILPVIEEMLVKAGFDASINFGAGAFNGLSEGAPGLYMFGHIGSVIDPYETLYMFHGRHTGGIWPNYSSYSNPEYDAILDEMAPLPSDDPRFLELAVQAMEIYWGDQIDIPIIQWFHRFLQPDLLEQLANG